MSSEFGKLLKVSVFGQSHGRAIGVNIDGLPAGDYGELADRPRPGHADYAAWVKWSGRADMRGGADTFPGV